MKLFKRTLSVVVFVLCLASSSALADAVTDWNAIALNTMATAKESTPIQARTMAMVHAAMYDAANGIMHRYTPYAFRLQAPQGASPEAAAVAAAHSVLINLYPDQRAALDADYTASMAKVADGADKPAGASFGEKAGTAMLALRQNDGANSAIAYRPSARPGEYVPTTLPVGLNAAHMKTFLIQSGSQFRPGAPPVLTSTQWARDYNEIKALGSATSSQRTPLQTDIARFWGMVGPSTWNPLIRQLSAAKNLSLIDNARLYALVEMAAADAYIAVFDAKYTYNFWRPITAIRNGEIDGNDATVADVTWLPLIDTPMHPEYPCAHCITSTAVGTVLQAEFGSGTVATITMTSPTAPGVTRGWDRISDYMDEVSNARVWAGVHYRNSTIVGRHMGTQIGEYAEAHYFKRIAATP